MNSIKSNPFVSGLAGITFLLCGIIYFFGSNWATRYDNAKAGFNESLQAVDRAENIPLYPVSDLRNAKTEALTNYRTSILDLEKMFDTFRPQKTDNITPQAFTDRLLAANEELTTAFASTELPQKFFLGFESYRSQLAKTDSTGILLYQMDGIKTALLGLAEARPSSLINVYREPLTEELDGIFKPAPNSIARYLSCEITFKGSEQSVRGFLNSLGKTDSHYFIIRTLSIKNESGVPPQVSDAKFERIEEVQAPPVDANPFEEIFAQPDVIEEPAVVDQTAPDNQEVPKDANPAAIIPPAPVVDTSRILARVLGNEELIVFVRFDIALFLPSTELPKP